MLFNNSHSYYTVETVLSGHPDKICDQICDSILDEYLKADINSHVAVECLGCGDKLTLAGEVKSSTQVDVIEIAKKVFSEIGYSDRLEVTNNIVFQSEQLSQVIDKGAAGDQGIMYGYATESQYNFLPDGVVLINQLAKAIDELRKEKKSFLPDGKTQLTIRNGIIETLIVSIQHSKDANLDELKELIDIEVLQPLLSTFKIERFLFNHESNFTNGGFSNDTGLSGRKIILDTYCGLAPHGGGAFSGKDPSKVDRSAAYMSRFVAKNIVANGFAKECLISVAYSFGIDNPIMLTVQTDNTQNDEKILKHINHEFDFRPNAIIERLNLKQILYKPTAIYGHFTNPRFPWEKIINF